MNDLEHQRTIKRARKDLSGLKREDFVIIRSYVHPSKVVQSVCYLMAILLGHEPNWKTVQCLLAQPDLLELLYDYDIECVRPDILEKMIPIMSDPNLTLENAAKSSKGIGSLFKWISAIYEYALKKQNRPHEDSTREESQIMEQSEKLSDNGLEL